MRKRPTGCGVGSRELNADANSDEGRGKSFAVVFFLYPAKFDNLISMSTQGTRWIATTVLGSGAFALYCGLDRFAPNITEMLVWREQQDRLEMLVGCA